MRIGARASGASVAPSLLDQTRSRLRLTLGRFAARIERARARIVREELGWRCDVVVRLGDGRVVRASVVARSVAEASTLAVDRAAASVARLIELDRTLGA
ncbi:MAG: hypothetical protein K8H88_04415 [Sandaracinaceae bacterium]|nr:hypothetical protein [Sandaracinaceae bacterium]